MRFSLSTRIFIGFAVVVTSFGLASLYGVAAVTGLRHELTFLRKDALPLIDSLRNNGVELRAFDEALQRAAPHDLDWVSRFVPNARPYVRADRVLKRLETMHAGSRPPRLARFLAPQPLPLATLIADLQGLQRTTKARDRIARDPELRTLLGPGLGQTETDAEVFDLLVAGLDRAIAERRLTNAARLVVEIRRLIRQVHGALGGVERDLERALNDRFTQAEKSEQRLGLLVAVSSAVSLAVSIVALLVMLATLRPIGALAKVVRRFALGDRKARADTRGAREIQQLAVEWNRMADALAERENLLSTQRDDLARSERLAALGQMAAHMTHEVRNPLSSIGLNTELLQEEIAGEGPINREEARELLEAIIQEVEHLRRVTDTYLERARRRPLERVRADLSELVGRLLDFARTELEKRHIVVELLAPAQTHAAVDSQLIRQALWNLLRNGWEALPDGGTLWIEVEGRVDPSEDGPIPMVALIIEDSGEGITEEARERLFEPFFSTKERGTGVGLALVVQVAGAHGGRVKVVPGRHGQGARFELILPARAD